MKKSIFERRIPTVFALLLLLGGLGTTLLLINQGVFTTTRATPAEEPRNITNTNITDNSVTIAFSTLEKTVAAVSFEQNGQTQLLFDDRDTDTKNAYYSHQITLKNLEPNTTYSYTILSNGTNYPETEGETFQATTSEKNAETPMNVSMKGMVKLPDSFPAEDTLLLITPQNGSPASVITNEKGEYVIPASILKNKTSTEYLDVSKNIIFTINAIRQDLESTINATFIPNGEIPLISLSQNYEFIASEETSFATGSSLLNNPDAQVSNVLQVLSPSENQTFVDNRPQFRGTARANNVIQIFIDGKNSAQLRSSPNGNWSFRPSAALTPGNHTIAVTQTGSSQRVTQTFNVFASGSQIAQSATPSATIAPTSLPTAIPTTAQITPTPTIPTVTNVISPTPTIISATAAPTILPTQIATNPSIIPTSFVPTKIPLPPVGNDSYSILLTGVAVLFIVTGSVLFFIL